MAADDSTDQRSGAPGPQQKEFTRRMRGDSLRFRHHEYCGRRIGGNEVFRVGDGVIKPRVTQGNDIGQGEAESSLGTVL